MPLGTLIVIVITRDWRIGLVEYVGEAAAARWVFKAQPSAQYGGSIRHSHTGRQSPVHEFQCGLMVGPDGYSPIRINARMEESQTSLSPVRLFAKMEKFRGELELHTVAIPHP